MGYTYWCAVCGNPDIIVEDTKSGYSMGKGIVGAAVLGPVGAVAGLDGKKTTSYYCPKCGARLDHCMPDYQVNNILTLLKNPEINRSSIEKAHERFPNMMMPKGWVKTNEGNGIAQEISGADLNELKRILQTSTEANAADRVYEFFKKYGNITEKQLWKFIDELYDAKLKREYDLIQKVMSELRGSCRIRYEAVNGESTAVIAMNNNEIRAWKWEEKADKIPIDSYLEFVKEQIGSGAKTVKEIEEALISKEPDINEDNPSTSRSIAKRACSKIANQDVFVDFDGDNIKIRSTKRTEDDLRFDIEEKWNESSIVKENVCAIRDIAPVLKLKSRISLQEIKEKVRTQRGSKITVVLKELTDHGLCIKTTTESAVFYALTSEALEWSAKEFENWMLSVKRSSFVGEETKAFALDRIRERSGQSFWSIMNDQTSNSRNTEKLYECFMILELERNARRTEKPKEYIWEFIDKQVEARKKREEERKQELKILREKKEKIEKEVENLKVTYEKKIPNWEELIQKQRSRVFDESEFTSKISELEGKRLSLTDKLSTLGFFNFKEKKVVNEEITKCDKDIEETRVKLEAAKNSFNKSVESAISSYQEEIDKAQSTMESKKRNLQSIESKINGLNNNNLEDVTLQESEEEKALEKGELIEFGRYPGGSQESILWRVLFVENGNALLISDKIIFPSAYDFRYYQNNKVDNKNVYWENCTLREYLNGEFYKSCFSDDEKSKIMDTKLKVETVPSANPGIKGKAYDIYVGRQTEDKVFVLSCSEAKKYFASNNERKAVPTDYAIHLGTRQIDGVCAWWLRDKTNDGSRITIVDLYGEIGEYLLFKKDPIYQKIGVRPALWIKTGF